ncbi:SpoIID/LytB domain-containing protein [bacterium]|nr:SpoIID/LytB domain-containing protein [bacterium]
MSARRALCVFLASLALALLWSAAPARDTAEIRVLLGEQETVQAVSGELDWYGDGNRLGSSSGEVTVGRSGDTVVVRIGGAQKFARLLIAIPRQGHLGYGGQEYRGRFELFGGKAGGTVVLNVLPLEDYLLGVVPREMPASWHAQALKAQAVAARTYAISRMAAHTDATYDVIATESDQVYRGVGGEDERTSQAVRETAGQIITYEGYPIIAYFSSDAGGYTKDGGYPYLQPVPSPNDDSPYHEWSFELSSAELAELGRAKGLPAGVIEAVSAEYDGVSGHLDKLIISGTGGSCSFSGGELRKYIGLDVMRSTRVVIEPLTGGRIEAAPVKTTPAIRPEPATGFDTVTLEGYQRPYVASADGVFDRKMRQLYAYNGWDLTQCNRLVHVVVRALAELGAARPETAVPETALIRADNGFTGIRVTGSGYGHARGLSQWGARQLAEEGMDYQAILKHFYTGVELVQWNGSLAQQSAETSGEFYQPFTPGGAAER